MKSVLIEKGETQGTQKVTLTVDASVEGSADISKEAAIECLGKKASRYVVKELEKNEV